MRGQLKDLGRLLKMSFCQDCMNSYYGRYHPENPALIHVLAVRAVEKKVKRGYYDSEELLRLARAELRSSFSMAYLIASAAWGKRRYRNPERPFAENSPADVV